MSVGKWLRVIFSRVAAQAGLAVSHLVAHVVEDEFANPASFVGDFSVTTSRTVVISAGSYFAVCSGWFGLGSSDGSSVVSASSLASSASCVVGNLSSATHWAVGAEDCFLELGDIATFEVGYFCQGGVQLLVGVSESGLSPLNNIYQLLLTPVVCNHFVTGEAFGSLDLPSYEEFG